VIGFVQATAILASGFSILRCGYGTGSNGRSANASRVSLEARKNAIGFACATPAMTFTPSIFIGIPLKLTNCSGKPTSGILKDSRQ